MPSSFTRNKTSSSKHLIQSVASDGDLVVLYGAAVRAIEENDLHELDSILHGFEELDNVNNDHCKQRSYSPCFDCETLGSLLLKASEINAQLSIVMTLVNFGANLNYSNTDQAVTCTMMAAKNGSTGLLNVLIQHGAKVNATDRYGWTALFYAAYFGHADCAKTLIEAGASVNSADHDGMSCLIWASGRAHMDVVSLLIDTGALVNTPDRYNSSALIWACRKGNTDIAEILLENGARVNERGMYGWTPLIVAVKGNHIETTNLLLQYEPDLSVTDGNKMSPLLIACSEGFKEIALELIRRGACVNEFDSCNNTPIIYAAKSSNSELVRALIQAGAIIEHTGQENRSAMHWSVIRNDVESCKLLLEHGIDTTATNRIGETYLMIAAKNRSLSIIQLLVEQNAQSSKQTPEDQTSDSNVMTTTTTRSQRNRYVTPNKEIFLEPEASIGKLASYTLESSELAIPNHCN